MSLYDSLKKSLTPEVFTQVTDQLGDDFDYDVIPRSRLNKVIAQRNELRKQLDGIGEPEGDPEGDPKPASKKEPAPDVEALKKQYDKEKQDAVNAVKIQYAVLEKLRGANAIDADLIFAGGLIDTSKVSINDQGVVTGVDELVADLQKNKAHLFKTDDDGVPAGTGKDGSEGFKGITTREQFLKLDANQQIAFKQANPTAFKQFLAEA